MVGEVFIGVNAGAFHLSSEILADDVVVNAPTDVIGARVAALAPPGVLLGVGMDEAEGVAEFAGEQIGQPRALLREETAVFQVALPVFQVFFGVGDVDVAAEDEALARRCPRVQPRRQFRHKGFFFGLTLLAAGAAVHIKANERKTGVARLQIAAFAVDFRPADAVLHRLRRVFQVQGDAAVALLFRVVIVVVGKGKIGGVAFQLRQLRLGFLDADSVGVLRVEPLEEALARGGTDAVGVECDDFEHVF